MTQQLPSLQMMTSGPGDMLHGIPIATVQPGTSHIEQLVLIGNVQQVYSTTQLQALQHNQGV